MADKSIVELFQGYLADSLTEGELRTLIRHLQAQRPAPGLLDEMDHALLETQYPPADVATRDAVLDRVFSIIHKEPARKPRVLLFFQRAAAVLLLLVASWLVIHYIHHQSSGLSHTTLAQIPDIPPGHQGAILTLSNGQKIILDSAGNGLVANEGDIKVIKKDGGISYSGKASEIVYNYISTARGRQWQLTLGDGSKVWLNAASSIRYPVTFTGATRQVEISGEAYFEIAKNPAKPFIVKTAGQEIRVLGTRFNVNSYSDEPDARITLLEGSVKITGANQSVIIRPGEQARQAQTGGPTVISGVDLVETMAWKDGVFRFRDATIEPLMRQIARWYDVEINYQGQVKQHFIATIPMNATASEVFRALEMTGGVHFKIEGRKITVMP
jgi:transmembrane sensor